MSVINPAGAGQVPVHVGLAQPGTAGAAPRPRSVRGVSETPLQERSALVGGGVDWAKHGVQPRWLGQDSSECAVALEPGIFHNGGDAERKRFLAGAAGRGERALLVSTIGDVNDQSPRNPLSTWDASVRMSLLDASIGGPRLPAGASVALAEDLDPVDRDLGLRLLGRPPAAWWALQVRANEVFTGGGQRLMPEVPDGSLHPILVDSLGHPVVAAWIPSAEDLRWYIVPDSADWNTVIDWLVAKALPAHAPAALRRARHPGFLDPELQTQDEADARQELADLDEQHAQRTAQLTEKLRRAQERATPVRNGLLYGVDRELQDAVALVLTDAGLTVVNLDDDLGGPESADLLVALGSQRRLVEVKSAGGNAGEKLVDFLRKHLETWPGLKPDLPVGGGVLIVNHQHKLAPHERAPKVYERRAFVDTLPFPVLSARELFDWWRAGDWPAVRGAIFGSGQPVSPGPAPTGVPAAAASPVQPAAPAAAWWRRTRRGHTGR